MGRVKNKTLTGSMITETRKPPAKTKHLADGNTLYFSKQGVLRGTKRGGKIKIAQKKMAAITAPDLNWKPPDE